MVGQSISKKLRANITPDQQIITKTRQQLDLLNQQEVDIFFKTNRPTHVYLAAAKVGGILANHQAPAEFLYENLMIQANIIHAAFKHGTTRLLALGSSCIYPKFSNQPIREEELLTGSLEATNEPYAIAKIAGLKLCESYNRQYGNSHNIDYRALMPTNLYGPNDNFDEHSGHVIPSLISRFHYAKINHKQTVEVWGSGRSFREFLHVDDLANAALYVMNMRKDLYKMHTKERLLFLNIGTGQDITIASLAQKIAAVVGFQGKIIFDLKKPEGTPKKVLDITRITTMGWKPNITLEQGLTSTYTSFLSELNKVAQKSTTES